MPKNDMDKAGRVIIKICIFSIVLSLTALLLCGVFQYVTQSKEVFSSDKYPVIVIDAGHGGEDGGAVSSDGIMEKDLNLSVALSVGKMLQSSGYEVIYTRENDSMLYKDKIKGSLKMQDLKNRLDTANSQENAILISIHMNKFSQEKYSGLQVFYSDNTNESSILAERIQTNIKNFLQSNNTREIKSAGKNIYILERAEIPAVLVECGFLSNKEECERLKTEEYRKELASIIYLSVVEFFNKV